MDNKTNFTYGSTEKLKSKKLFEQLFSEGKSVTQYPIRLVYAKTDLIKDEVSIKAGVTVSKRKFKSAVKRNRIKRVLREAYRLNKSSINNNSTDKYALLFLYLGKEMPKSSEINTCMVSLLNKFNKKIAVVKQKPTAIETSTETD
ncbi:ribonuclease P protein component [Cellulophaga baltica]|uniref:ribonuclease P protein component n=1 Tax=Cellulophaga TaxID=104264 RepID=UPI001C07079A|nr:MULTISPECIES: ribonuclease P protein component [Cellulophaga]MBU2995874.1 ribonuclease P protein component [Cellulophaga baltica]MDO6767269.1 ribonuclease P protein component [Cellulophaga sp. 1_MG-2023]